MYSSAKQNVQRKSLRSFQVLLSVILKHLARSGGINHFETSNKYEYTYVSRFLP
jgi:hypothetical protein